MAKAKKEQVKEVQFVESTLNLSPAPVKEPAVYDSFAYSIYQKNGTNNIIEIPFNTNTLEVGVAKIVEHNTDHYVAQERLQVLLLQADMA